MTETKLSVLLAGVFWAFSASGQETKAVVGGGYSSPAPLVVAPGQVITLFAQGVGAKLTRLVRADRTPLPTTLAGISVSLRQFGALDPIPVPLLAVSPVSLCSPIFSVPCSALVTIIVQIPFELAPNVPGALAPPNQAVVFVSEDGVSGRAIDLLPVTDRIHVVTSCDFTSASTLCDPIVTHAEGSLVSASSPATGGEVLVMYALGLGRPVTLVKSGEVTPVPAPTLLENLSIAFDFRINAAPARPFISPRAEGVPPSRSAILFAGLSPGSVGLYQINFQVPAVPGIEPCGGAVRSNLTVSVGGPFSFDGAAICVK